MKIEKKELVKVPFGQVKNGEIFTMEITDTMKITGEPYPYMKIHPLDNVNCIAIDYGSHGKLYDTDLVYVRDCTLVFND